MAVKGRQGKVMKRVMVQTNDPEKKTLNLSLKANVVVELAFDPSHLYLSRVKQGDEILRTLKIVARKPGDVRLGALTSDDPAVKVKLVPDNADGGVGQMVEVRFKPTEINPRFKSTITLETGHPKIPSIDVRVQAAVEGDIVVQPNQLYIMTRKDPKDGPKKDQPIRRTLWVRSREVPFKILKVTSDMKHLSFKIETSSNPSKGYRQEIKVEAIYQPYEGAPSIAKGTMQIHTNHKDQRVIPVEVNIREQNPILRSAKPKALPKPLPPGPAPR